MPALIEIDGVTYTAILSEPAVEIMERITNYGFPHITYGLQVSKFSDLVAFTLGCIDHALPAEVRYLTDSERKAWLYDKLGLLRGSDSSVTGALKLRAVALQLIGTDTAADEEHAAGDDSPNAPTPPAPAGGHASATSSTATSKSATRPKARR